MYDEKKLEEDLRWLRFESPSVTTGGNVCARMKKFVRGKALFFYPVPMDDIEALGEAFLPVGHAEASAQEGGTAYQLQVLDEAVTAFVSAIDKFILAREVWQALEPGPSGRARPRSLSEIAPDLEALITWRNEVVSTGQAFLAALRAICS